MSQHPANLILRFVLEIAALVVVGQWGWQQGQGALRYALAFGLPLLMMAAWGTFTVPNDPSRSPKAVVRISGRARLVLELVFFSAAVAAAFASGRVLLAGLLAFALVMHHLWSMDRLVWLYRQ